MKKISILLIGILFSSLFSITDISAFGVNDHNIETNLENIEINNNFNSQVTLTNYNILLMEQVTLVTNDESNDKSNDSNISQQHIQSTKNIKLIEKLSILENDKLNNLITYVKHNSEKLTVLERVYPNRIRDNIEFSFDKMKSITPKQIIDSYNTDDLISKQSLNVNLNTVQHSIPIFSTFDFAQNSNNIFSINYDLVTSTQNIISTVDENNQYLLVLLVPLSGYILLRTESRNINFINTRLASSSILTIILISSAILTPFSIGSNYWGIAYAEEFSFSGIIDDVNNLESNTVTTQPINATSTQPINATSTQPINATSTQPINATSTQPINATSTQPINATSTQPINATSTQPINATSTQPINATSTQPINATSTQPINATLSEISSSNETSDTLLDLNFDTENTNQTSSATLELDGNEDFITIQNNSTDVLSTFTVSGWIKPDYSNGSNEFTILSKENSFVLSVNNNIKPEYIAKFSIFDGIKWTYVESNSTIAEQWTHISTTFDGNYIKIYINGKLEGITELADTITISANGKLVETQVDTIYSAQDIVIGAYVSTNDGSPQSQNKFSGEIDNISLHDSIFDEQKLTQIYQEQSDYYSSLDVELSLEEIMQQIIQENALATNSTLVPINSTVTQLDLVHETIEIGNPVIWTQTIELSNKTDGITIELPEDAEITQVTTMDQQTQETLYNAEGIMNNADIQEDQINNLRIENSTNPEQYDTLVASLDEISEQVQQDKPTKLLVINNTADQIEIKFETPAPYVIEEEHSTNSLYNKTITVAHDSTLHYTNVTSYSAIPEELVSQGIEFDLFWNINGTKMNVTSDPRFAVQFVDTNGNGIVDQMQWIVPQMSEQEFEIVANIIIINVQSYPIVGGTWEVRFTTNGTADLVISAINGTTFGESLPYDLNLLSIKCGENTIQHQWVNGSIVVQNYTCNETGYETSQVLTPGKHHLEFKFGNSTAYANNNAFVLPPTDGIPIYLPVGIDTHIDTNSNVHFIATAIGQDRLVNFTSAGSVQWNSTSGTLDGPTAIAINSTGYIFVVDTGNDKIKIFQPGNGQNVAEFGSIGTGTGQFQTPMGIAINSTGWIYVVDTGNDRIQIFDPHRVFSSSFGSFGTGNRQFDGPVGIAINSTNHVYVADTGNDRIQILNKDGSYSNKFGLQGSGDGQFRTPMGIASDSSGNIYVADTGNDRTQKLTLSGSFIESLTGTFSGQAGISVFDADNIYTADTGNDKIKKHDTGKRDKTESLPLTATATTTAALTKSLTESLPLTATVDAVAIKSVSLTESLSLSDNTVNAVATKSVSLTESLSLSDNTVDAVATKSVSLTESLSLTATVDAVAIKSVSLTESLSLTATVDAVAIKSVSLTESLSLTATVDAVAIKSVSLTESLPLTDTLTKSISKNLTESLSLTATVDAVATKSVSLTESLPLTATVDAVAIKSVSLTESLSLTATVDAVATKSVSLIESLPLTDTLTKSISKNLTESLSLSATVDAVAIKSVSLTESLSLTATVNAVATKSVSLTESLPLTDTLTKSISKNLTELLSLSDNTVSATGSRNVSLTESLPLTDTLTKSISKNLTESLFLSDNTVNIVKFKNISLTESLPLTDTLTKSISKNLTESLSLTATVDAVAAKSVSLTESLSLTATVNAVAIKSVSLTESLSLTATVDAVATKSVSLIESLPLTDTLTKSISKNLTESLSLSATVDAVAIKSVSLTESLSLTATVNAVATKSVSLTESLPLTDTLTKSISKNLTELLSLSDNTVSATGSRNVSLTESLPLTDTLTKSISKNLTESLFLSDNTVNIVKFKNISLTESLSLTDTLTKSISKNLTESLSLSATVDAVAAKSVSLTESLSLTATVNAVAIKSVSLTESLPLTDTLTKSISKNLTELLSLSDNTVSATGSRNVSLTESLPLTDTLTKSISKNLTESLFLSDNTVNIVKFKNISLTESLSLTDTLTKSISKNLTESLSLSDNTVSATGSRNISLTESLSLTATVNAVAIKSVSLTESLSLSDNTVNIVKFKNISLTESLSLTDTLTKSISKNLTESLSLSDNTVSATGSRNISLTESLRLTATVNVGATKSVSLTESLSLTDTLTKSISKNLTESLSLSDNTVNVGATKSVSLTESLPLTALLNQNILDIQTALLSLKDNLAVSVIPANNTLPTKLYPGSTTTAIKLAQNNTSVIVSSSSVLADIIIPNSVTTRLVINYTSLLSGTTVSVPTGIDVLFNTTNTNSARIPVNATISTGTTLTGPSGWNGVLNLPITTSVTIPQTTTTTNGVTTTTTYSEVAAIELGVNGSTIQLSSPARILFTGAGVSNPIGFFVGTSGVTTFITTQCTSDSASGMPASADECYFDNGNDLIIWTDHFTKFGASQRSTSSSGSSSSGSSTGGSSTSGGGQTGVGPTGTTRRFGGILSTPLTINEITYDKCQEYTATILVSSDADKAPSVTVHTSKSGSISATLANIQPYEQSNKITKLDKYLYEIPITSDETFLMVVVTEDKGVTKNTVQAAIHLESCEGTTIISEIPEEEQQEIAPSAPKIFDVKFQIENSTQHSSETESEFYYVDNQDLSVSAIVDAQNPLQRSELRITTIGQSQDYVAIKMDVESLPVSNSTYVISATIPSSLMQEPAITYWIHVIDEDQNEAESKQYNIGVKPISVGDVSFEMDIPSIKESGSLVRPQLFVDNNDLPSYGIVSLVVNEEVISKKSQLFATGETIVNLEWKSPGIDEHTIYDVMASVDLYDKSISTQSAKLHIYPKTITMLASEIKSLEPIIEDDTVLADPALIYASNSVDQNLRFHVIAPNGQCIIGVSEECAVHSSTANQRGGLTSIEYEDQIIRVRYSGPDSSLERFSITSVDPLADHWIVSLETSDGIIPQAQAMKDLSIKVKYRTYSETITVYSE